MPSYTERFYRNRVKSEDLVSFWVKVKETDLLVSAAQKLEKETRDLVFESRHQIESYIQRHASSLPPSMLFTGKLAMDSQGYLIVDRLMHTDVPGVFAAGEIADPTFWQVITSAGMGAAAAMQAIHFLESQEAETVKSEYPVAG